MERRIRLLTAITSSYAHAYQALCLTRCPSDISCQRFRLPCAKAKYPDLPNNRTTTRKKGDDFEGWAVFTDGGTHASDGETTAGWGAVVRSLDERHLTMFGPVITTEAHLAYAGARLHNNNTAELSGTIEALSFLRPAGPVTRGSQACIFYRNPRNCG